MNNNYEIRDIKIENLYVNPGNARFINSDEIPDELSAINAIISLNAGHVIDLAKDIASDGLNPNDLPIVMYDPDIENFLVMEGNRRISSIKLMTQYTDRIDNFNLTSSQKRELKSLKCNIKSIRCIIYEDEEYVNYLLEKIHTSKPGIRRAMWDPQAQDRHQEKSSETSKRLAIVKMLNKSKYTDPQTKLLLSQKGWFSKLDRFATNKYMFFFGIKFDPKNNILLYINEAEVMKGLVQLVLDLQNNYANNIAQTEDVRLTYLANFPDNKKPNLSKKNDPLIMFDSNKEAFIQTSIKNQYEEVLYDLDLLKYVGDEYKFTYTNHDDEPKNLNNSNEESIARGANSEKTNPNGNSDTSSESSEEDNSDDDKYSSQNTENDDSNDSSHENNEESNDNNPIYSTERRTTLIPKDEEIPISDQRVVDLYEELKLISVNKYVNIVSISLRSLIEFSINCFLDKYHNKWAFNTNIELVKKLEKVLSILESKKGKKNLQLEIPAIYMWLHTYETDKSKCHLTSIAGLNILIHNHLCHPNPIELKTIYNNYSPFLKNLWEQI